MGGLLAIPVVLASAVTILTQKGFFYWLCYCISYAYLTVKRRREKKRFDLYDYKAVGQPDLNTFFLPKKEWELDPPLKSISFENQADHAFFYGTNSKSEHLAVHIARLPEKDVLCSLSLKLVDGKTYSLPDEHAVQTATSEDNTFGSSRLKLQCLIPMRKWRIFFNGILKQESNIDENSSEMYKHVKFTFIWTASSEIYDFSDCSSIPVLSHVAASSLSGSWSSSPFKLLQKIRNFFNCYDQPGMILGTVSVENEPENEVYLWGSRSRFMGNLKDLVPSYDFEVFGNFENGALIFLAAMSFVGITKRFMYGYLMTPTGYHFPIDKFEGEIGENVENINIKCLSDNIWYSVKTTRSKSEQSRKTKFNDGLSINAIDITLNGKNGKGLVFKRSEEFSKKSESKSKNKSKHKLAAFDKKLSPLSVPFNERICQESELCGGKGSSLGILYALSQSEEKKRFSVPRGIVVATEAYKEFTKGSLGKALQQFETDVWKKSGEDIQKLCQKAMEAVKEAELPEKVAQAITKDLKTAFGESLAGLRFAVRSSATGEDTEQMSAAGQMETFLGVKSIPEILNAVKKCWASQFSFQAIEYKRGYGQRLNTPMAVVVQEMVNCDVAGVMFTCDPVTGHPLFISITANWGLGESVVSASSDPDTILLERTIDNKLKIHSKKLGNKKTKIIIDGDSGTREVETGKEQSTVCSINDDMALKLGQIASSIESHYGSPRDLEWGVAEGNIFLFQSRPVTSLDIETDFETKHFFDNFLRTEKEAVTKANVGEVMPGATSPLGVDILNKTMEVVNSRRLMSEDRENYPIKPYFQKGLVTAYNHILIQLTGGFLRFEKGREEEANSFIIALFGRLIDFSELRKSASERTRKPLKLHKRLFMVVYFIALCFISGIYIRKRSKKLEKVHVPLKAKSSAQLLRNIGEHIDLPIEGMSLHMNCTFGSSFWNMSMLSLLAKSRGEWDNVVFSDFAYLLSTCNEVESADVPAALQDIGASISSEIEPEKFKKMSVEDAYNWLQNDTSSAGGQFKQFLQRHGHRCLKEFDVYTETWGENPKPVIKMLQNLVNKDTKPSSTKVIPSFDSIVSKLHINLSFKNRLRLRWLLPNSRRAVREREFAKSVCINMIDKLRKPFHRLAELMVEEGRLPRKELLFFLCVDEIAQLINTRSPRIVSRAVRRWRVHESLDGLRFPEICYGIPKPVNDAEEIQTTGKGFKMTGVPVSQGIVKATARVVMNLEEASTIQQGDILITYSTDIGWSPYFTLLSGVVTELGGLISHGAVVAREYGLPCVVSLHGATRAFKSGELVILDGNTGTLQRVEDE